MVRTWEAPLPTIARSRDFTLYNIKHFFGVICYMKIQKNSEKAQILDIPTIFDASFVQFDGELISQMFQNCKKFP